MLGIVSPFADVDDSGVLSFSEFVHVCATYCMYSQDDILDCELLALPCRCCGREKVPVANEGLCVCAVCFNTFDVDSSGTLDEVIHLLQLAAHCDAVPHAALCVILSLPGSKK